MFSNNFLSLLVNMPLGYELASIDRVIWKLPWHWFYEIYECSGI